MRSETSIVALTLFIPPSCGGKEPRRLSAFHGQGAGTTKEDIPFSFVGGATQPAFSRSVHTIGERERLNLPQGREDPKERDRRPTW
jgi:hypothetical protein